MGDSGVVVGLVAVWAGDSWSNESWGSDSLGYESGRW